MKKSPNRMKYKKYFKMPLKYKSNYSEFKQCKKGKIYLYAKENGRLTSQQLEAFRKVVSKKLFRKNIMHFIVFPQHPITSKGIGIRMGRGKGKLSHWVILVNKGDIIFELLYTTYSKCYVALKYAKKKLPINTGITGS